MAPSATANQTFPSATVASQGKDVPDLLVVVLDVNPVAWADSTASSDDPFSLQDALQHILVFINAHLAGQNENRLAVYAATVEDSRLLFTTASLSSLLSSRQTPDANTYQYFKLVDDKVSSGVRDMLVAQAGAAKADKAPVGLVGAMSKALCHINRLRIAEDPSSSTSFASGSLTASSANATGTISVDQATAPFKPRMLVFSITPDASAQYVPIMNCIFSAQKAGITIDVCDLSGPLYTSTSNPTDVTRGVDGSVGATDTKVVTEEAVFLQQAAHLTGGAYFRPKKRAGLIQNLMVTFLPSRSIRNLIALPSEDQVDFRAACFCHKRTVDIGFVCSVCLSIFCTPISECSTCRGLKPLACLTWLCLQVKVPASKHRTSQCTTSVNLFGFQPGSDRDYLKSKYE